MLRNSGLALEVGGRFTPSPKAELGPAPWDVPSTRDELRALWSSLPQGARRMLDAVLEKDEIAKEDLAESAEMEESGGTFARYLSMLVSAGLVDRAPNGRVAISSAVELLS
jgi:hypothetical protein